MTTTVPPAEPLVSVIVVTFNSGHDVSACLSSLQRQTPPKSYEVIVVDNASADDSADQAEAWAAQVGDEMDVTVIRNQTNSGYAAANNQAVQLARGRLLALVNPDAVPDDGCLAVLVDHLVHSNGVGAAAAVLTDPTGEPQAFARRDLSLGVVWWDMTELGRRIDTHWRDGRGRRHRRYEDQLEDFARQVVAVDCPAAACVVLWRDLIGARLFDERMPLFFNDGDLYRRMRDKSYRVEVVPGARARHGYGTSHRQVDEGRKRAEFVSSLRRYSAKHFSLRFRMAVTALLLVDAVGSLGLYALQRKRRIKAHALGTLGGLWLPGGAHPWLTPKPSLRRRLSAGRRAWSEALRNAVTSYGRRRRRRRLIRRLRWQGWLLRAKVDVRIHPDADIGDGIDIEMRRGQHVTLTIDDKALVASGVLLRLWGGTLHIGHGAQIRRGAVLIVKGLLDIAPRAVVSRACQLHADGVMHVGFGVGIAERATIVDTLHDFDDVPVMVYEKGLTQADITLEPYSYVGANAVIMPGITVGRLAVVASQSVVTRDVDAATVVGGIPAKPLRQVARVLPDDVVAAFHDEAAAAAASPGFAERKTRAGTPAAIE